MNVIRLLGESLNANGAVLLIGGPGAGKHEIVRDFLNAENVSRNRLLYITPVEVESYSFLVEEDSLDDNIRDGIFKKFVKLAYNELLEFAGVKKVWEKDLPILSPKEIDWVRAALKGEFPRFYVVLEEFLSVDPNMAFGGILSLFPLYRRLFQPGETIINLINSGETFGIPPNLFIIATATTWKEYMDLYSVYSLFRIIYVHSPMSILLQYIEDKRLGHALISALTKINSLLDSNTKVGPWLFIREIYSVPPEKQTKAIKEIFAEKFYPMLSVGAKNVSSIINRYFQNDKRDIPLQQKILSLDDDEFISFLEQIDSEMEDVRSSYQQ